MRTVSRLRRVAVVPALAIALALGLWLPIPTTGDSHLTTVMNEVRERLPGWRIIRAEPSWEGGYTVVAACATRELGFQLVPGHGLGLGDAWIQPNDLYARSRLARVSDHEDFIIWYQNPVRERTLTCRSELARDPHFQASTIHHD